MRDPNLTYCANGHVMTITAGTNCGCHPDADCSVPVYSCRECGDSDYGQSAHADLHRSLCPYAKECKAQESFYETLPPLQLTKAEFDALDDYSATNPTGTYPGRRWRRHDGAFDPRCKTPVWIIGEYAELFGRDDCLVIKWHIPVIRLDAPLSGDPT
jgi:hypothetical protein